MSKAEDDARDAAIAADPLANAIYRFIDDVPAASRLYPDLYALGLAEQLRAMTIKSAPHPTASGTGLSPL